MSTTLHILQVQWILFTVLVCLVNEYGLSGVKYYFLNFIVKGFVVSVLSSWCQVLVCELLLDENFDKNVSASNEPTFSQSNLKVKRDNVVH